MSDNPIRLAYLFDRYAAGTATVAELEEFWQLVAQLDERDVLPEHMQNWWEAYERSDDSDLTRNADGAKILKRILEAGKEKPLNYVRIHRRPVYRMRRTGVAAAVLLILLGGIGYWSYYGSMPKPADTTAKSFLKNDVLPGTTKATLTLDDGRQLALDTVQHGLLAEQGVTRISNTNGALVYNGNGNDRLRYNTLTTHKGEQYPLILSDGTRIFADASTTIRFPVAFTGSERVVEINGRAWFEVAKNAKQPFYVVKGDQKIRVLGTHFDVNAYDNEVDMKVTLVEGSVQVMNGKTKGLLKPGQQAVLTKNNSGIRVIEAADVEQATAWKDGVIAFHHADVATIMREVERWYDVDITIKGTLPNRSFYFSVPRTVKLSELLRFLEVYNIRYEIDGEKRKLTLMP